MRESWASAGGGAKRAFLPWKLRLRNKISKKIQGSSLIPIDLLNSWNDSLLASMSLTLHKIQVHCSGVMQWRAWISLMSTPLPAEAGSETCNRNVPLLGFIA